ncbi:MAG: EpsG family protein, partial [Eubacterium sp.]
MALTWPFSAIGTFVVIVAAYSLLYFLFKRKNVAIPFAFAVIALSVLAYYVMPNETDDLARYFDTLEYMKTGGRELLQHMKDMGWNDWDDFPVYAEYFYFISRLPSVHFLPAVTIFIVYSLMFLILYKAANRFEVNKLYLYIASMFLLSTYWYYDTLSGIRNGLVYAIIIACVYYHIVEKKNIVLCCVGYILACLFHSAGIIPVAIVAVVILTKNVKGKYVSPIMFFGIVFGSAVLK